MTLLLIAVFGGPVLIALRELATEIGEAVHALRPVTAEAVSYLSEGMRPEPSRGVLP